MCRTRMSGDAPDFVMMGVQTSTGVRLFASKVLTHADMEFVINHTTYESVGLCEIPPNFSHGGALYTINAKTRGMTVVDAPDYPAAFAKLFDEWSPTPERVALNPTAIALPAAPVEDEYDPDEYDDYSDGHGGPF